VPLAEGKYIVYTDDNPDDVLLFKEAVRETHTGCGVKSTADGQALLNLLASLDRKKKLSEVAFIVLDVLMPRKDGIQVLFDLKVDARYRPIPVIMWTGAGDERDKLRAYSMGCNTYLEKPDNYPALVEKVRGLMDYWLRLASLPNVAKA
jgi:CheY-like chemotaxis protein